MVISDGNTVNPIQYLDKIAVSGDSLVVEFVHHSSKYSFYLEEKKLLYATNSLLANGILERNLKYLSHQIPSLKNVWNKLNLKLEQEDKQSTQGYYPLELKKIIWLAENRYLDSQQLTLLGKRISQEIIESLLLIPEINVSDVRVYDYKVSDICQNNLDEMIAESKNKVIQWQTYMPEVQSTYQRPYLAFVSNLTGKEEELSSIEKEKIGRILRGFNFRELGALFNIDELLIVKRLYPLITRKTVVLRHPKNKLRPLPQLSDNLLVKPKSQSDKTHNLTVNNSQKVESNLLLNNKIVSSDKIYNIVCIDDSVTVLNCIKEFLNHDNLSVFTINNAAKAMILMTRIKPDLIFMDIGMPLIDGYQLCSLLRKNPLFKNIPIIMLTASTGLINRAKAKLSGATDYVTKPFTQDDLLEIAFRYLSDE